MTYHLRLFVATSAGNHGFAYARLGVPTESVVLVEVLLFTTKRFTKSDAIPIRHHVVQNGINRAVRQNMGGEKRQSVNGFS